MEYFNVYTQFGEKTDEIVERNTAHKNGTCHRVFHLWIVNSDNQILVQQRSAEKDTGANLWYVSVGGHIAGGETIEQAITRETKEEIGIDISNVLNKTQYLYSFKECTYDKNSNITDDEFYDVFVLKLDIPINKVVMQESEVQAVKYMNYNDFKSEILNAESSFVSHETAYEMLVLTLDNYLS